MNDSERYRVYLKLASVVLEEHRFSSIAELSAEVKAQCIKLKLPYDDHQVDRALQFVTGSNRMAAPPPQTRDEVVVEMGRPLTHQEARECLRRTGFEGLIKTIPSTVSPINIYGSVPRDEDFGDHDRY